MRSTATNLIQERIEEVILGEPTGYVGNGEDFREIAKFIKPIN